MATSDFTQIAVGPVPVQVCPPMGNGSTVTIYNADILNVVTVARNNSVSQNASDGAPIQPLTSAVLAADKALYAVAPKGTAPLVILPGGGSMSPSPAQIATQINALGLAKETTQLTNTANTAQTANNVSTVNTTLGTPSQDPTVAGLNTGIPNNIAVTGVPLLTKSTLVKNQGNISQAPGATSQSATFPITQIGYEILLTIFATGNFLSWYHITMTWFDSGTGLQTAQEDYWFNPGSGSGANAHTIFGTGPTKGDQLIVTSSVPAGSSVNVTHSYVILQNSRLFNEDNWQTIQFNTAGFVGTAADETASQIGASSLSVGASTSSSRVLPFFNGIVSVWCNTGAGNATADFQIVNLADTSIAPGGSSAVVWEARTNANGFLFAEQVPLPAGQCQVILNNLDTVGRTLAFTVTAARQR